MNTLDHDKLTPDEVERLGDLYADVAECQIEAASWLEKADALLKQAGALLKEADGEPVAANVNAGSHLDTPSHTNRFFLAFVAFHDGLDGDDFDHALGILNIAVEAPNRAEARSRVRELLDDERTMFQSFFWEHGGDQGLERPCTDNGWSYSRQPLVIETTEALLAEAGGVDIDLRHGSQAPLNIDEIEPNSLIDESGDEFDEDYGAEVQH